MKNKLKLLVLVLAMALLVYGCDEEPVVEENGVPEEVVAPGQDDEIVVDDDSNGILDRFRGFVLGSREYMVTYEYSFMGQDMSMTQYASGSNFRTDSVAMGVESRNYILGDRVVTCMLQDSWMCFETDMSEVDDVQAGADPVFDDVEHDSFDGVIEPLPGRTIAGVSADCFRVVSDEYDGAYTYCFSSQGIPLFVELDSEFGDWRMIATEFSSSVPGNAFDLPAEPGSLDDIMGAWGDFEIPDY